MLKDIRFWLSIADNDVGLWVSALAAERGLEVGAHEPGVSPSALQGAKAKALVRPTEFAPVPLNDLERIESGLVAYGKWKNEIKSL